MVVGTGGVKTGKDISEGADCVEFRPSGRCDHLQRVYTAYRYMHGRTGNDGPTGIEARGRRDTGAGGEEHREGRK